MGRLKAAEAGAGGDGGQNRRAPLLTPAQRSPRVLRAPLLPLMLQKLCQHTRHRLHVLDLMRAAPSDQALHCRDLLWFA
jgi:hypothetical protein